jgi:NAD(P)-dependent dehydrogenase (short-subunit alcohol dehydrogenase family)/carbon monoxide dehydrogenase subunit G
MVTLEEKRVVPRSLEDVYRYLADFSTIQQWDPGVYRANKFTAGGPAVGTEYDLMLNSAGRRVPMRYVTEALEPPANGKAQIVLSGEGSSFGAYDVISLAARGDDQTEIHYKADLTFSGGVARMESALQPWLNGVGKKAVDGMATALTPAAPQPLSVKQRFNYRAILPAAWSFTERGYWNMPNRGLSERMDGKVVLITGPTAGLGLAAACEMARLGATLLLLGRGQGKLAAAKQSIQDFAGVDGSRLHCYQADLLELPSINVVAENIAEQWPSIDVVINNAGALFAKRETTADGCELGFAVNFMAPYLLTEALLPRLTDGARVINVVSGGMYLQALKPSDWQFENEKYDGSKSYARAKRALMAYTQHWAEQRSDLCISAMHPGWAATPGVEKSLPGFNKKMQKRLRDSQMGADTMVWLASASAQLPSGKLWFDRQQVPTEVIAKTRVTEKQWQRLQAFVAEHCAPLLK